jgi:hypothetical protein
MTRFIKLSTKCFKIGVILSSGLIITSCATNRYLLNDKGSDKRFLVKQIKTISSDNEISKHPILVIDGIEYVRLDSINLRETGLQKKDIEKIELLKMEPAVRIFGDEGERGVLLITTKADTTQHNIE